MHVIQEEGRDDVRYKLTTVSFSKHFDSVNRDALSELGTVTSKRFTERKNLQFFFLASKSKLEPTL